MTADRYERLKASGIDVDEGFRSFPDRLRGTAGSSKGLARRWQCRCYRKEAPNDIPVPLSPRGDAVLVHLPVERHP
jgi:hypothetical protein